MLLNKNFWLEFYLNEIYKTQSSLEITTGVEL